MNPPGKGNRETISPKVTWSDQLWKINSSTRTLYMTEPITRYAMSRVTGPLKYKALPDEIKSPVPIVFPLVSCNSYAASPKAIIWMCLFLNSLLRNLSLPVLAGTFLSTSVTEEVPRPFAVEMDGSEVASMPLDRQESSETVDSDEILILVPLLVTMTVRIVVAVAVK